MVTHLAALLGAAQLTIVAMCLLLALSSVGFSGNDIAAKKLGIWALLLFHLLSLAVLHLKPAGTGAEGSPVGSPQCSLPVLGALIVGTAAGLL